MASLAEKSAGDSGNFDRARFDDQVHVGARLAGRYRLERKLRRYPDGEQAPPQAWVGFDEVLNREVGIDLVASGHPRADAVEAAARNAATVPDVRFVQVLDVADENGLVYVVTEWVADATDLTRRLAGGPLSVAVATRVARELAQAMTEAHSWEMPHGALDPDKILVTSTNQVKILGLCLETAMAGGETGPAAALDDVKAIGSIWYAALTARWPGEESAFGLAAAPRTHDKPFTPAQIRAAIPKAVDQLVEQVLTDGEIPAIDSTKALASAISALPRMRDEQESTDVLPRPMQQRRPPVYPVAAPTAVQMRAPSRAPAGSGSGSGRGFESGGSGVGRVPRGLLAVILGVVVVVGAVAAFQLGGRHNGSATPPSNSPGVTSSAAAPASAKQLTISKASIWDSDQGTDDQERLQQSYNGSAEGWVTSTYKDGPDITSYRKGTGIIFDLGSAQKVGKVTFTVGVPGATVEVWTADAAMSSLPSVANSAPPGFSKQSTKANVGGGEVDATFSTTVNTRYVMVWFTVLPHQNAAQYEIDGYRDSLANVKILS